METSRRNFLNILPILASAPFVSAPESRYKGECQAVAAHLKLSLNAYSFNDMLMKKQISKKEVLEFCARAGFAAVDMTGYYFSSYPATPSDQEIFDFKRKAHELGLEISGTGVRNEFSHAGSAALEKEIDLVKRWIEVAAKLGAPVLRIFTAKAYSTGEERKRVTERIEYALHHCLQAAAGSGIILGIQNHNDYLRTADECYEIIQPFNSSWLGLVLDTGTFVAADPYAEIAKATPLAVNWQLKEKLIVEGKQTLMDLPRLCKIIRECGYRGNVPIETLGLNDPINEVPVFLDKVRKAFSGLN